MSLFSARIARSLLSAVTMATAAGCAPLTFSNEGSIDFDRYRSVTVMPVIASDGDYATDYLRRELDRISGFALVATDLNVETDLTLQVRVSITRESVIGNDGDVDVDYEASGEFDLVTLDGVVIDSGIVTEESNTYAEALEDTLDEIAHRYLMPYRT